MKWVLILFILVDGNPEPIRTAPAHDTEAECYDYGAYILKRWSESSDPYEGASFKCEELK